MRPSATVVIGGAASTAAPTSPPDLPRGAIVKRPPATSCALRLPAPRPPPPPVDLPDVLGLRLPDHRHVQLLPGGHRHGHVYLPLQQQPVLAEEAVETGMTEQCPGAGPGQHRVHGHLPPLI